MALTPAEKDLVATSVRSYIGVQWLGQGRSHQGIDCIGIVVMGFRGGGKTVDEGVPDYQGLDPVRLKRLLLRHCDRVLDWMQTGLEVGDVVVYGAEIEVHVCIIVAINYLRAVHCPMDGAVVETRFDINRAPIKGVYRWRS